ncbi:MAG: ATP-binding protein [Oceanipulchritudo sp.]
MDLYKRLLHLPAAATETFFLWGARQAGKSSLLRRSYRDAVWIDLLKADVFRRYTTRPETLREELEQNKSPFVVVDEVQKVPALLDEIHWLHENRGIQFALCGSSARKLKRGHGNLLGGRAVRFELYGLCAKELGGDFNLQRMLSHGTLPRVYNSAQPQRLLNAYVGEYLREEVMAEGLVRNLPPFSEFLNAAALGDTEQVNFTNIARELGVSRETVRGYYGILSDTLLATLLPVYRKRPKRRLSIAEKFYFHDVGVVNFLARRGKPEPGSEAFGKAFENWVFHELRCYNQYAERFAQFSFWRLSTGVEVDFTVNDLECAVECKSGIAIRDHHLKGLRELKKEHPACGRRVVVCREPASRKTADGIEILSVQDFLEQLWEGRLF